MASAIGGVVQLYGHAQWNTASDAMKSKNAEYTISAGMAAANRVQRIANANRIRTTAIPNAYLILFMFQAQSNAEDGWALWCQNTVRLRLVHRLLNS